MQVTGKLTATPELTWEELKTTAYIPFEYAVMQGRNSQTSLGMQAQLKERMIETSEGEAFAKYADSLVFDLCAAETLTSLVRWIEKAIETFPGHSFEGRFTVIFSPKNGGEARIEVEGSNITVSTCRQVWVPSNIPDAEVSKLFHERGLAQEAQRLLQRVHAMNPIGLHWGDHDKAATGVPDCLGCDLDNFLACNAPVREMPRRRF